MQRAQIKPPPTCTQTLAWCRKPAHSENCALDWASEEPTIVTPISESLRRPTVLQNFDNIRGMRYVLPTCALFLEHRAGVSKSLAPWLLPMSMSGSSARFTHEQRSDAPGVSLWKVAQLLPTLDHK